MSRFLVLGTLSLLLLQPALAAPLGRINLPDLRALEAKASSTAEVTLDERLLGLAAKMLDPAKPDEARARDVVAGLQAIYVRSYSFDTAITVPENDFEGLRHQLEAPGWSRIVSTRNKKDNSRAEVYLAVEGTAARGLVVIATEPKEVTLVNIVGAIDLDKLRKLEGQFGVPKLDLDSGTKAPVAR